MIAKRTGLESLPEGTIADNEVLLRVTDQLATAAARLPPPPGGRPQRQTQIEFFLPLLTQTFQSPQGDAM